MKVLVPLQITDSVFVTSSIEEPDPHIDPEAWVATNAYVVDPVSRVSRVTAHKIYENNITISGSASNDPPEVSVTRAIPKWIELGSTNRWAMFDNLRTTPSISSTENIIVRLQLTDTTNGIAFLNMVNVNYVNVVATSSDDIVRYSNIFDVSTRNNVSNWYEYFYTEFITEPAITITNLPTEFGALTIEVTFTGAVGMKVGSVMPGTVYTIGKTQLGGVYDTLNFSGVERDTFGTIYMTKRRNIPKTSQRVYFDKASLNTVLEIRNILAATPALWIGIDDSTSNFYGAFLVFGFYRDFSISVDNPIGPMASIEVEEL